MHPVDSEHISPFFRDTLPFGALDCHFLLVIRPQAFFFLCSGLKIKIQNKGERFKPIYEVIPLCFQFSEEPLKISHFLYVQQLIIKTFL